jgi:hypothetical protein
MDTVRERSRRRVRPGDAATAAALLVLALALTSAGAFSTVLGAFKGTTSSSGNQVSGASDWVAPTASGPVIQKTQGGVTGYIRPGGTYRVYANVADAGSPASGVTTVTANVSSVTSGQTAAALTAGSFTIGGQGFAYASAILTANAALTSGSYSYSVTSSDQAGNSRTQSGFTVVGDATAPTGADVQTANLSTGTAGLIESGDTITFTFSELVDPGSIVSGWTGAAPTTAVVRITNGTSTDDILTVYNPANTSQLPLGSVDIGRNDYVAANISFGATGTPSTITVSGNTVVVTLGTGSAAAHQAGAPGTMKWTTSPPVGAIDRAGNPVTASVVTESGAAVKAF